MKTLTNNQNMWWWIGDDRYILIAKENDVVIGLNLLHGDESDISSSEFRNIDQDLTNFYNSVKNYLPENNEIDKINQIIDMYFVYKGNF